MNRLVLLILVLLYCSATSFGQKEVDIATYAIRSCKEISSSASIHNIYIDDAQAKWIATPKNLYQLASQKKAKVISSESTDWLLLHQTKGNYELILDRTKLRHFNAVDSYVDASNKDKVTTTFFDKQKKMLWIGTNLSGMYRYHIGENIRLVERLNMKKMNLLSNKMNSILVDSYGREWIGTEGGLLFGEKDKWKTYKKGSKVSLIKQLRAYVWVVAKDAIWQIDKSNNWTEVHLDSHQIKGRITDLVYDENGFVWIASEILTRYQMTTKESVKVDFPSSKINCLEIDAAQNIWVGTADMGLYMLEKNPRKENEKPIQFNGKPISQGQIIPLKQVYFEADSIHLSQQSIPSLQDLKVFLQDYPTISIEIGGHTNDIPKDDFCLKLSTNRAKTVANYLINQGIAQRRVQYKGYGRTKPIASNESKEGRRKNQRVEVKILSIGM